MNEKMIRKEVRFTEKEYRSIVDNSEQCGLGIVQYIKECALGHKPQAQPMEEYYLFFERVDRLIDEVDDAEFLKYAYHILEEVSEAVIYRLGR